MSRDNGQAKRLEVGMDVIRTPETICCTDDRGLVKRQPMKGCVTYVHPKGRYHIVAFQVKGGTVKESFKGISAE